MADTVVNSGELAGVRSASGGRAKFLVGGLLIVAAILYLIAPACRARCSTSTR